MAIRAGSLQEELEKRRNLIDTALRLYAKHSEEYRTIIPRYNQLLEKKRELKIEPLRKLNASTIAGFPEIKMFRFEEENDLLNYLDTISSYELSLEINQIYRYLESAELVTIRSRVYDFDYEVKHINSYKSTFGIDPDRVTHSRFHSATRNRKAKETE